MSYRYKGMQIFRGEEIVFLSHPKTGRTWLRYMLMRLNKRVKGCPSFSFFHKWGKSTWKKAKGVVYLVRDPRDVVVSYFFEKRLKERNKTPDEWCKKNLKGILNHYKQGYELWKNDIGQDGKPKYFKAIRYEDFHQDCAGALKGLLVWAHHVIEKEPQFTEEDIEDAVFWGSFDQMKKKEFEGGWYLLQSRNKAFPETYKCRKGKVGGYVDYLAPETIEWLNVEMTEGEHASPFSAEYLDRDYHGEPRLVVMRDFPETQWEEEEKIADVSEKTSEVMMSKKWKECLLECTKDDVVVWIGAWPSEQKMWKYDNLDHNKCHYIDPLYKETKGNLHSIVISNVDGKERVYVSSATQNTSLFREHADKIETVKTVKALTLDSFYGKHKLEKVTWLHCNAEGAEYKIVSSTKDWIDKTENGWIEFHKFLVENWKTEMLVFKKLLEDKGFKVETWDAGTYEIMVFTREK